MSVHNGDIGDIVNWVDGNLVGWKRFRHNRSELEKRKRRYLVIYSLKKFVCKGKKRYRVEKVKEI